MICSPGIRALAIRGSRSCESLRIEAALKPLRSEESQADKLPGNVLSTCFRTQFFRFISPDIRCETEYLRLEARDFRLEPQRIRCAIQGSLTAPPCNIGLQLCTLKLCLVVSGTQGQAAAYRKPRCLAQPPNPSHRPARPIRSCYREGQLCLYDRTPSRKLTTPAVR